MPAPLVAAGAAAIARFIAQKGMKEAVKKFGKKAVDEAKKHGKDMVTKPTSGQSKVKKAVSGQRANRETMRRTAGVAGGTLGAAGYGAGKMSGGSEATKPKAKAKAKTKPKAKDPRTNPKDFPVYGKSTDSAKAFREAQRKAKRNGQKTFTFEGRRYNTTEK